MSRTREKIHISNDNLHNRLSSLSMSYIKANITDPYYPMGYGSFYDNDDYDDYYNDYYENRYNSKKKKKKYSQGNKHKDNVKKLSINFYYDVDCTNQVEEFTSKEEFLDFCNSMGYFVPNQVEDDLDYCDDYYCCVDVDNYNIIGSYSYTTLRYYYYSYD